jgi:2-isopropylmalate synthase
MIIDPRDIGRVYDPLVRADSEAAGPAAVMETRYGFKLPSGMQREFSEIVRKKLDLTPKTDPEEILEIFRSEYIRNNEPLHFRRLQVTDLSGDSSEEFDTKVKVTYSDHGRYACIQAAGNGPLDAVQRGLLEELGIGIRILDYEEHALQAGSDSQAAAYIHMMDVKTGRTTYGVGVSSNITRASVRAVFSGLNRFSAG